MSVEKPSKSNWLAQHPVVTTLLWLIKGENKVKSSENVSGKVSWKDENGSDISVVFSGNQGNRNNENVPGSDQTSDSDLEADTCQSPQWGFYVSITPPQQEEFYPKLNGNSISARK